jgi:hypothetical protein
MLGLDYAASVLPTVNDQTGYDNLLSELDAYGIDTRGLRGPITPLRKQKLIQDLMPIKDRVSMQAKLLGMEATRQGMALARLREARLQREQSLKNRPLMGKASPAVEQYAPIIDELAGADAPIIKAMVSVESGGDKTARSSKGAQGLLQLMPDTAKDLGVTDPTDPQQNLQAGITYYNDLVSKYGDRATALAAYNWGPGNLDEHLAKYGELRPDKLPKETQNFLSEVSARLQASQDSTFDPTEYVDSKGMINWEEFNRRAKQEGWAKDLYGAYEDQVKNASKSLKPETEKGKLTENQAFNQILIDHGKMDSSGQWFVTPELSEQYKKTKQLFVQYVNDGMSPLNAYNKATKDAAAPSVSGKVTKPEEVVVGSEIDGKKVVKTGVNKTTGKRVVQFEDGSVKELD